jgi:hypothetical protein
VDSTYHLVQVTSATTSIPIGLPLPNYECMVLDEYFEPVIVGHEGELFVGGVGVFLGYLGRDDLTSKVLIEIDGQIFYRTGDLVRLDNEGLIHYVGRKDYQIKLRGQRIELAEIEKCLLDGSSHVSACVVIKWADEHLIAYIQGSNINEKQLLDHCRHHLPPFMVPSMIIILDQFPLNSNGKLDRKQLPQPDFSSLSLSIVNDHLDMLPTNELQISIHSLWCEILQCNQISIQTSIFSIGGHSLLLMQLYHRYKMMFDLDTRTTSISQFFQYSTIIDHARLIEQATKKEEHNRITWLPLHLSQGKISLCLINTKLFSFCFFPSTSILCSTAHLA